MEDTIGQIMFQKNGDRIYNRTVVTYANTTRAPNGQDLVEDCQLPVQLKMDWRKPETPPKPTAEATPPAPRPGGGLHSGHS